MNDVYRHSDWPSEEQSNALCEGDAHSLALGSFGKHVGQPGIVYGICLWL